MTAAIGILAGAPVPGLCKTRLIPAIGAERAARLQRHLIDRTLATASEAGADGVVLFTEGDTGDGLWSDLRLHHPIAIRQQRGDDLGARMSDAMHTMLATQSRAVLIGPDCLTLTPVTLRTASAASTHTRMVVAPAEDGGYVLVGASTFPDSAFQGIAWGGTTVLSDTRQRLRSAGWAFRREWTELDTHWDIDRPADLNRAVDAGLLDASWGHGTDAQAETADPLKICHAVALEMITIPEVEV